MAASNDSTATATPTSPGSSTDSDTPVTPQRFIGAPLDADGHPMPSALRSIMTPVRHNSSMSIVEIGALSEVLGDARGKGHASGSSEAADVPGGLLSLVYGVHSIQGARNSMEDAHSIVRSSQMSATPRSQHVPPYGPHDAFFAVFDGHAGDEAAQFCATHLADLVKLQAAFGEGRLREAVYDALVQVEANWMAHIEGTEKGDGTTAVVALFRGRHLVVANVGDSEAVLCRNGAPHVLTTIHNPKKNAAEEARVVAEGGRIWRKRVGHPVFNPEFCSIAVSRAIGDISLKKGKFTNEKPSGLVAIPDIQEVDIDPETDSFLIMGCDGLWDVFQYQEAIDFVSQALTSGKAAQDITSGLVESAFSKGSTDNITVILIFFSAPSS